MEEVSRIESFEDLKAWKACRAFRLFSVSCARQLPGEERYLLGDQIRRSARSITANIAEGYGRYHYKENIQFCRQARGSLYEVLDHFITAHHEKLITSECLEECRAHHKSAAKILNGYINYLLKASSQNRAK